MESHAEELHKELQLKLEAVNAETSPVQGYDKKVEWVEGAITY